MRKYGQHFLVNQNVIEAIVDAVPADAQNVVEIGPGQGALTRPLAARGFKRLSLVEIDPDMAACLRGTLPAGAAEIILSDFLKLDLHALPQERTFFVGNLPYIDAADILNKTLDWAYFDGAVFMFQKEQAQRILVRAGEEGYGPLSILSGLRAEAHRLLRVGKGSFNPPPKVESMVLTFKPRPAPFARREDWARFAALVKAAFAHRRKTLYNSLVLCGCDARKTADALKLLQIKEMSRAQEIPVEKFLELNDLLSGAPGRP